MGQDQAEITRRTAAALDAIQKAFAEGDDAVTLFVSHHLEEIEEAYWQKHAGTPHPTDQQVLDILVLADHWDEDDDEGIQTFDFTLPGDATNYLISVYFTDDGQVDYVTMES